MAAYLLANDDFKQVTKRYTSNFISNNPIFHITLNFFGSTILENKIIPKLESGYLLIQLVIPEEFANNIFKEEGYTILTENHLRIDKSFHKRNSQLSCAHLTQVYQHRDSATHSLQLHVHFNEKNQIISIKITCSDNLARAEIKLNSTQQKQIIQQCKEPFEILEKLQRKQVIHFQQLLQKSNQLQQQLSLIYPHIRNDRYKKKYLEKADEFIKLIKEINLYTTASRDLRDKVIRKIVDIINDTQPVFGNKQSKSESSKDISEIKHSSAVTETASLLLPQYVQPKELDKKINLLLVELKKLKLRIQEQSFVAQHLIDYKILKEKLGIEYAKLCTSKKYHSKFIEAIELQLLEHHGLSINEIFEKAIFKGDLESVKQLLEHVNYDFEPFAFLDKLTKETSSNVLEVLHYLNEHSLGYKNLVKIWQYTQISINTPDCENCSAPILFVLALQDNHAIFKILLEQGLDANFSGLQCKIEMSSSTGYPIPNSTLFTHFAKNIKPIYFNLLYEHGCNVLSPPPQLLEQFEFTHTTDKTKTTKQAFKKHNDRKKPFNKFKQTLSEDSRDLLDLLGVNTLDLQQVNSGNWHSISEGTLRMQSSLWYAVNRDVSNDIIKVMVPHSSLIDLALGLGQLLTSEGFGYRFQFMKPFNTFTIKSETFFSKQTSIYYKKNSLPSSNIVGFFDEKLIPKDKVALAELLTSAFLMRVETCNEELLIFYTNQCHSFTKPMFTDDIQYSYSRCLASLILAGSIENPSFDSRCLIIQILSNLYSLEKSFHRPVPALSHYAQACLYALTIDERCSEYPLSSTTMYKEIKNKFIRDYFNLTQQQRFSNQKKFKALKNYMLIIEYLQKLQPTLQDLCYKKIYALQQQGTPCAVSAGHQNWYFGPPRITYYYHLDNQKRELEVFSGQAPDIADKVTTIQQRYPLIKPSFS